MVNTVIHAEDIRIASDTDGIRLALRHKWEGDGAGFTPERTVLLLHGATFPSASLYDVSVPGGSFMDLLAGSGLDVWTVDVRGFGGSDRPPEMERDPAGHPPLSGIGTALRDVHAAVRAILARTGLPRLSLFGMSWGGSVAGAYAAGRGDLLDRLVLVAPLWLLDTPAVIDPGGILGAYRRIDARAFRIPWLTAAPADKRADLIPAGWFELWAEATLATDPAAAATGLLRAPSGPVQDIRDYWRADRPFYEPADIRVPVLLVHAEWDEVVPLATVRSLFLRLTGTRYRRWIEIGESTHMLTLEKHRRQVTNAVAGFLVERYDAET